MSCIPPFQLKTMPRQAACILILKSSHSPPLPSGTAQRFPPPQRGVDACLCMRHCSVDSLASPVLHLCARDRQDCGHRQSAAPRNHCVCIFVQASSASHKRCPHLTLPKRCVCIFVHASSTSHTQCPHLTFPAVNHSAMDRQGCSQCQQGGRKREPFHPQHSQKEQLLL